MESLKKDQSSQSQKNSQVEAEEEKKLKKEEGSKRLTLQKSKTLQPFGSKKKGGKDLDEILKRLKGKMLFNIQ